MKAEKKRVERVDSNGETLKKAAAKGALVWGTAYSTVTSGATCLLAPVVTGTSLGFGDVFMDSLIIFPVAGAARGLMMWKMHKEDAPKAKDPLVMFTSKGHKPHKHSVWRHKHAA